LVLAGCAASLDPPRDGRIAATPAATSGGSTMSLSLTSSSFQEGGTIPATFTCDGQDQSPDLAWADVPAGTKSLALIVDDPDAPRGVWVHWVVYNLPPESHGLTAGAAAGTMPAGARPGTNDWHRAGYGGPCPPSGRHRYVHTLYALDTVLPDLGQPSKADLTKAMTGHVLSKAVLTGTYARQP
jgi:Raf kinase inhibitor-like YbhB/YbcL family protein